MQRWIRTRAFALAAAAPAAFAAPASFNLVIIPPPAGAAGNVANDLNAGSVVVGKVYTAGGARAFRWTPSSPAATSGTTVMLGTLAGCSPCDSDAVRVNVHGHAVGYSTSSKGDPRAVLWKHTTAIDLGLLPGYTKAWAKDINDEGVVVGRMEGPTVASAAFRWTPTVPNGSSGTLAALPYPSGGQGGSAHAINNAGLVAGFVNLPVPAKDHAVRWSAGGAVMDLHFSGVGSTTSRAMAVNASERIVGDLSEGDISRGYVFASSAAGFGTFMGMLPDDRENFVLDQNGPGRVVGRSSENHPRAFMWTASGGMQDLNALIAPTVYELREARGINDARRIVGLAHHDADRAFLLIPALAVPRPVDGDVAVDKRPYIEVCDPLHACQTVRVTNIGARSLAGPLQLVLSDLSPGRRLVGADGSYLDAPFVSLRIDTLEPGASAEVLLRFERSPNGGVPTYGVAVYSGEF